MKKMRKLFALCLSFMISLSLLAMSVSAMDASNFHRCHDKPIPAGKDPKISWQQKSNGLGVTVQYTKEGDWLNLYLNERVPMKKASVEYTLDSTDYAISMSGGYLLFAYFKNMETSKTLGMSVMVFEAPVTMDSFAFIRENYGNKYDGKTMVIIQDIMGNKINEAAPTTVREEYPSGNPEDGWLVETDWKGKHSFQWDVDNAKLIFDGVSIPIQKAALKRLNMGEEADLVVQAGCTAYGKNMSYTLHSINGVKIDGSATTLHTDTSSVASKPNNTDSKSNNTTSESNNTTSQPGNTVSSTAVSSVSNTVSIGDTTDSTAETSSEDAQAALIGTNVLGIKSLNTAIDFDNHIITLKKDYTVGELLTAFIKGNGYDYRICDSSGTVITDESKQVDETMKLQLYFGDEPDQTFSIKIASETTGKENTSFPWWIVFVVVAVVVIAGGVVAIFVIKKHKAAQ